MSYQELSIQRVWYLDQGQGFSKIQFSILEDLFQKNIQEIPFQELFEKKSTFEEKGVELFKEKLNSIISGLKLFFNRFSNTSNKASDKPNIEYWIWTSGMLKSEELSKLPLIVEILIQDTPPQLPSLLANEDPIINIWNGINKLPGKLRKESGAWLSFLILFFNTAFFGFFTTILPFLSFFTLPMIFIFNRGWRFELLRNHETDRLPSSSISSLLRYMFNGGILWIASGLYSLPVIVLLFISGRASIIEMIQLAWEIIKVLIRISDDPSIWSKLVSSIIDFLITSGIVILYSFLVWPIFRVGMMRFALSGSKRQLFEVRKNSKITFSNHPTCMHLFFQDRVIWFLAGIVSLFPPFIPIVEPIRIYLTGHVYKEAMRAIFINDNSDEDNSTITSQRSEESEENSDDS